MRNRKILWILTGIVVVTVVPIVAYWTQRPAPPDRAKFELIAPNMTQAEVEAILGKGEAISKDEATKKPIVLANGFLPNSPTVQFLRWQDRDGKHITAGFEGGKLIYKGTDLKP